MRDFGRKQPKVAAGCWKGVANCTRRQLLLLLLQSAARDVCELQEQIGTTRRGVILGRSRTISSKFDRRTRNPQSSTTNSREQKS